MAQLLQQASALCPDKNFTGLTLLLALGAAFLPVSLHH